MDQYGTGISQAFAPDNGMAIACMGHGNQSKDGDLILRKFLLIHMPIYWMVSSHMFPRFLDIALMMRSETGMSLFRTIAILSGSYRYLL
jgi:hypothetical protein